jgi:uncharacterized protein (TIGR03437 family)
MTDMKTVNNDHLGGNGLRDCERGQDATVRGTSDRKDSVPSVHSMTRHLIQRILWCGLGLASAWPAAAQGPKAVPAALLFSYQVNGATPLPAQTVQVTVPAGLSGSILTVAVVTPAPPRLPVGWLTVTPDTGRAPLALSVMANPTNLSPGSYSGQITVTSPLAVSNPAVINVTLSISNPPSSLSVTSPAAPYFTSPPPALAFTYSTGDQALGGGPYPTSAILNIATTGSDSIQFNVTAASTSGGSGSSGSSALRVAASGQTPSVSTAGFAIPGNFAPIIVSLDPLTLDSLLPGTYAGTVSIVAIKAVNGSATVTVSLQVSAGAPKVNSIWPVSVNAAPVVAPVIDIAGDNFFSTSVVTIVQDSSLMPIPGVTYKLISRKHLQATIPVVALTPTSTVSPLGGWTIVVTNPGQAPVATQLTVTDGTVPAISTVVDSASFLSSAFQSGTLPDPVLGMQSVAPREIISIFGQNLGPVLLMTAVPAAATGTTASLAYPTTLGDVQVQFQIPAGNGTYFTVYAPLIMVSGNQINAVVPAEVAQAVAAGAAPAVTITVLSGGAATLPATVFVVPANPAIFTFAGLGQGQAAVLNYDASTSSYAINSAKNAAGRGSTISIYTTGMGDLAPAGAPQAPCTSPLSGLTLGDGDVACGAIPLPNFAQNVNVLIDGQLSVVTYAGTSPGSVGGLVQINAVVPPTAHAGAAITLQTTVGDKSNARRSQPLVTMGVK